MRKLIVACLWVLTLAGVAWAQQPTFRDSLLDRLAGAWVLQGTIAGKQTTHDVTAEWVLAHQFLRVQEVSREKKNGGEPAYQAVVFIGWDQPGNQYVCVWLDDYGGLANSSLGHAKRSGDEIPFVFPHPDGPFHNTFAYDKQSDTWQWRLDAEEKGQLKPFARVRLMRK